MKNKERKKIYPRFHGIFKATVVTVLEGEGTKESPFRRVFYVYNTHDDLLGVLDHNGIIKMENIV